MGWIRVKQALPEFDVDVLVYNKHHDDIKIARKKSVDSNGVHWSCDYQHHLTHWMPLPEPPKEDYVI